MLKSELIKLLNDGEDMPVNIGLAWQNSEVLTVASDGESITIIATSEMFKLAENPLGFEVQDDAVGDIREAVDKALNDMSRTNWRSSTARSKKELIDSVVDHLPDYLKQLLMTGIAN